MTELLIMKDLLNEIEKMTIAYNKMAEEKWLKKMTFNTIAETRYENHKFN